MKGLGVFDDTLVEIDYDDIQSDKLVQKSSTEVGSELQTSTGLPHWCLIKAGR